MTEEQHVYHHYDNDGARVNVSFERNSRGTNYSATVTGAKTAQEAIVLLMDAEKELKTAFPENKSEGKEKT